MGNLQQLRMQSILGGYDQLTPGAGGGGNMGYSDEDYAPNPSSPYSPGPAPGLEQIGAQQGGGYELGSEPEVQSPIQTPTIDPIGAPGMEPDKPRSTVYDMMDAINKGYTPATTARDRYDQLLNEAPERNRPGILRTLAAGGLSLKAQDPVKTTEQVMYAPYYRQQADWKEKAEPYFKAAELENRANINERTLVSNAVQAQTNADKLAEAARQADQKADIARTTNRIREAQAAGLDVKLDGDRWVGFDQAGKMHDLGSSRGMTREQIIDAQGRWNVKASGARADAAAANSQGTPYEMEINGKRVPGTIRGDTFYPLKIANPGEAPGSRAPSASPGPGVGTSVPITPPGTTPSAAPSQPVTQAPRQAATGALNRIGTVDEKKVLTPLEQRMETNNKIAGILSRHPDWNNFVNYNSDTEVYEGMGAPPQPPKRGLFGMGSGSDEDWTRYKNDMDGYNYLRSLLHPGMAPYPTVGGSNAEQKAQREKAAREKAAVATPSGASNKISSPEPTRGIGPSGSTSAAPSGSGSASIGPTTTPNSPKTLPGGGSDPGGRGATPEYPYGTWGARPAAPKSATPKTTTAPPPTTPLPIGEPDNGPDPLPERAAAGIPRGSKVDVNGNTFRYTDPQGNVRYYSRETNGWVDYDPTSGPRRRR